MNNFFVSLFNVTITYNDNIFVINVIFVINQNEFCLEVDVLVFRWLTLKATFVLEIIK